LISRRNFLKFGIFCGGAFLLDSLIIEPRSIRVEARTIRVRGLPARFDGFTICQITDVHASPMVSLEYVEKVVDIALGLTPDLVVLTGDYIDESKQYMAPAIKCLSRLKARHGVVSILGNHDHFFSKGFALDVLTSHGIPVLDNSHMMIERGGSGICIAGVADFIEDSPDPEKALKGVEGTLRG
jgi:predicted MPP superfamily phosphohydrolase